MIKELIKLATHLDSKGHRKEADYLDAIITKMSMDFGSVDINPDVREMMPEQVRALAGNSFQDTGAHTMEGLAGMLQTAGYDSEEKIKTYLASMHIDSNVAAEAARRLLPMVEEVQRVDMYEAVGANPY